MSKRKSGRPQLKSTAKQVSGRTAKEKPSRVDRFVRTLSIKPHDIDVYRTALTHRSAAGDAWKSAADGPSIESNERLEFLGDAILGAIVAEVLYKRFPDAAEGTLTRRRSAIVRAEQLTAWARELQLADFLYLAQSESVTSSGKDRMLAGAFEALVGALALDQGDSAARKMIESLLLRDLDTIFAGLVHANPKGRLQEFTQDRFQHAPTYHTLDMIGPAHERTFTVEVRFRGLPLAMGTGASKRAAEENAASAALARLRDEGETVLGLTP